MTYNVETAEHAWLDLTKEDVDSIKNPLIYLKQEDRDTLHLHVLKLMRKPE